nr:MAG TPA: hypothetical protein [Caudoviricetes sp.]
MTEFIKHLEKSKCFLLCLKPLTVYNLCGFYIVQTVLKTLKVA